MKAGRSRRGGCGNGEGAEAAETRPLVEDEPLQPKAKRLGLPKSKAKRSGARSRRRTERVRSGSGRAGRGIHETNRANA